MKYYYIKAGDICGPVSLDELRIIYQRGEIAADAQASTEGADSWESISSLLNIGELLPVQQPAASVPPPILVKYSVVPFVAVIGHGKGAEAAAAQLENLIQNYARNGWDYVRLESVETYIAGDQGCFGIGGTPARATAYSMAVFKRR